MLFDKDWYLEDYLPDHPDRIGLIAAMLLAHEATHVWQWENRARTGYSPLKAAREHRVSEDPYLFDPGNSARFLDHGYEQQGAIVEEYVCCHVLDPEAPRTARLREMISAEMPVTGLEAVLDDPEVLVPWRGIQPEGICR